MDGMLSQDEINALLTGMDKSENPEEKAAPKSSDDGPHQELLTAIERDAIGEIANISMGSSATTLFSLVNLKVDITTPQVEMANWHTVVSAYERPCVFIQIRYTTGLEGSNIMILKEHDVKIITDLMMGGDGSNTSGELEELHLSAISEAMNQMMGAAATSMSTMLERMIDISPPTAKLLDLNDYEVGDNIDPFLRNDFVKISFRMQIGDLVDSTIMQLYPLEFAKGLYDIFMKTHMGGDTASAQASAPMPQPSAPAPQPAPAAQGPAVGQDMGQMNMGAAAPQMGMPQAMQGGMTMGYPGYQQGMPGMNMGYPVYPQGMPGGMNIQPAQFHGFDNNAVTVSGQENIGLIKDVPLDVTVELGRTKKSIAEILDFAPGTIIELDRIAGEPIDVLVNGKFVARGEVVVIEESFGIRVTEIIK